MIRKDTDMLTGANFLYSLDSGGGSELRNRSLLEQIGEVSLSLFLSRVASLMGIGHVLALVISPIILGVLCLIPPVSDTISGFVRQSNLGAAILVGLAAGVGVLFSLLCSVIVWRIFFERDLLVILNIAEQRPLWSVGPDPDLGSRTLVHPRDDPEYNASTRG